MDESGCTALAALCVPGRVFVANAGDCGCVLWRGDELLPLSREHTAQAERERIVAAGGTVSATADGKLRVGGVIQVSRCIGDRSLRRLGLTAEPEVQTAALSEADKALVIASDGLWDVMPAARVLHALNNTARSPDLIAKRLIFDAMDRGADDNISVVVLLFGQ